MARKIRIELTKRDRDLIAKYGYPFEEIKEQIQAARGDPGFVILSDEAFWWEQVVGNLSISVNEDVRSPRLVEELCDLADRIEFEIEMASRRGNPPGGPRFRVLPDPE